MPSASQVTVTAYKPEEVILRTSLQAPGYVVLSDSWYPGWKATVDGEPTSIERANVAFRAVYVPEGDHIVHLIYRPLSYV
ncbi:MAG: YfhO family protein, partial [Anaerolineae bacterium]|nr:YfhO family protein [Anaerolineae bacterium]NIQ82912.1 YfhO family protein [Anaerolineae bacterium]